MKSLMHILDKTGADIAQWLGPSNFNYWVAGPDRHLCTSVGVTEQYCSERITQMGKTNLLFHVKLRSAFLKYENHTLNTLFAHFLQLSFARFLILSILLLLQLLCLPSCSIIFNLLLGIPLLNGVTYCLPLSR